MAHLAEPGARAGAPAIKQRDRMGGRIVRRVGALLPMNVDFNVPQPGSLG